MFNSKVFLAEFIGTFALVFVGMSAGIVNAGLLGVALAHGFTLAVFAYAYGHISGTHVNPAVTFGLALKGVVTWGQAIFYWIAQFAGAILAAFLLKTFLDALGGPIDAGATIGALTDKAPILAMVMEAVLTFFLLNTILHTAVGGKGGRFAGWAIGTTYAFAILAGAPFTGASLNPARTFGPAIFSLPSITNPNTYLIYLFGPLIGATLAVLVYNFFTSSDEIEEDEEEEVVVVEEPVVEEMPVKAEKKSAARKTTK
ncbi:aquaporin [Candidatus Villigracilis affinis]|uniref:MIP/aquaporin family protein n=1 Tax=Candidatus Villigracilis affinis TaxID=3140682 RepID=UPI002A236DFF|nr:aquaporin [Anaerolineales bacterium]